MPPNYYSLALLPCISYLPFAAYSFSPVLSGLVIGLILSNAPSLYTLLTSDSQANKDARGKREAYDIDHVMLNLKWDTLWLNMGYWKDTKDFPTACEALARKLADLAEVSSSDDVLDVGYGCGESIILLKRHYRPKSIVGVTSLASHHEIASRRLKYTMETAGTGSDANDSDNQGGRGTRVELKVGDAVKRDGTDVKGGGEEEYDKILALDCAYHFNTRNLFLRQSFHTLRPKGRISLSELIIPSNPSLTTFENFLLRLISVLAKVPFENLVTLETYISQLEEIGYEDIRTEDVTPFVFGGLASFIGRRSAGVDAFLGGGGEGGLGGILNEVKWRQFSGFGKVLNWWDGGGEKGKRRMRYVLISAMKP